MQRSYLDRYSRLRSPVHALPPAIKLVWSAALVLIVLLFPRWPVFLAVLGILVILAALSRIPPLFLVRRMALLEPVIVILAAANLFRPDGWEAFGLTLTRSTLALFVMVLFANVTPFDEALEILRRLRLPPTFITVLALLYRYLFVLIDEADRMQRARMARTVDRRRRHIWPLLGTIIGELFVRSTERAERIHNAMQARGWR